MTTRRTLSALDKASRLHDLIDVLYTHAFLKDQAGGSGGMLTVAAYGLELAEELMTDIELLEGRRPSAA